MSDVVVTVPKRLWLDWIDEGDAAGDPPTGEEWGFFMGGSLPNIKPGERVYIVSHGRLRGYSPLTMVVRTERGYALCREAGACAVTIVEQIMGFRGWRVPWWDRNAEVAFPCWRTEGVVAQTADERLLLDLAKETERKKMVMS
jgi:hypothetical protein